MGNLINLPFCLFAAQTRWPPFFDCAIALKGSPIKGITNQSCQWKMSLFKKGE